MRKEILPEMLNYNKFPGPEFIHFDNHVKSDSLEFIILENVKDAFNATSFGQRYTELLLKYDYIVGDWGNEQLRLRGFYKDENDVRKSSRISRLDDYIKEFCNFGCAYFVLENLAPQEIKFEEERAPRRKRTNRPSHSRPKQAENRQSDVKSATHRKSVPRTADSKKTEPRKVNSRRSDLKKTDTRDNETRKASTSHTKSANKANTDKKAQRNNEKQDFSRKKRQESSPNRKRPSKRPRPTNDSNDKTGHFIIRKKDKNP
ncbi:YutD family protein [Streptococcus hongkongensis]|nr:transcriptional regulator [Streptococcus uberis]